MRGTRSGTGRSPWITSASSTRPTIGTGARFPWGHYGYIGNDSEIRELLGILGRRHTGHGQTVEVDLLQELFHNFQRISLLVIEEGLQGGRPPEPRSPARRALRGVRTVRQRR